MFLIGCYFKSISSRIVKTVEMMLGDNAVCQVEVIRSEVPQVPFSFLSSHIGRPTTISQRISFLAENR